MFDVEKILSCIESGDYKLTFEEPNNISLCTKYDGSKFYLLSDDNINFGVCGGFSVVEVAGYTFYCDLGTGDWSEGDGYNGDYVDDDELVSALESIPGILCGEMLEPDEQMEVYYKANPGAEQLDYFWCEDEDRPKDIEALGWDDVDIIVCFSSADEEEWTEEECSINDELLYKLYLALKCINNVESIDVDSDYEIFSYQIKNHSQQLFEDVWEVISDQIDIEDDAIFKIKLDSGIFEANL